jgi:hypothetical protein
MSSLIYQQTLGVAHEDQEDQGLGPPGFIDPFWSKWPKTPWSLAVLQVTEARLVNTLTSTSLTSRSRVISALGRYNQKCGVVENEYV